MRPIATWSVCVSVYIGLCVGGTPVNHAKTDEPIEIAYRLGEQTRVGPRHHLLNGGPYFLTGRVVMTRAR